MDLVREALRVIREARPEYWVVENVRGAIRFFRPVLGEPAYRDGTWYLWGRFPGWLMPDARRHFKGGKRERECVVRSGPSAGRVIAKHRAAWGNSARIAMIPYAIARGLAEACKGC